ncbi:3-methylornithine--L-lysine ligase PylC [Methanosarcina sp. KYL-1]|uniref:3-methylornithine--L-lysine ligase PylC n=1 Tax=Methanosarcina sp. KYL-1 TaxID=2602068 RepID=UPI002101CD70|nr:3-methylornithine--L-lysine ligase PylC [Methanosarcina sp. KYL-1]
MKTICLVGGKLQGFEAAYLAKKAEMKVVLVDRNPQALTRNFAHEFHCFDVTLEPERLIELSKKADFLLPVNENLECIEFLESIKERLACPVLFDFKAYGISRDKKKSKDYFASIGVPTPADKPSQPPYFVKPPCESSSVGARIIHDEAELKNLDPGMLIEEYVEGEVVSLEVIGDGSRFAVVKETLIHIDGTYDCHMVTPLPLDPAFREISHALAANLPIKGIMDVEAIAGPRGLKVIEIDARFPSQTPTAVYHSSGVNLLELLVRAFEEGVEEIKTLPRNAYCIYEHLMLGEDKALVPVGEQVLSLGSEYGEYFTEPGLEILLCKGKNPVFTLVAWGPDKEEAENRKSKGLSIIGERFGAAA